MIPEGNPIRTVSQNTCFCIKTVCARASAHAVSRVCTSSQIRTSVVVAQAQGCQNRIDLSRFRDSEAEEISFLDAKMCESGVGFGPAPVPMEACEVPVDSSGAPTQDLGEGKLMPIKPSQAY